MKLKSLGIIFSIHMGLLYAGLGSLPLVQVGALAVAFTIMSVGGMRILKLQ